MELECYRLYEYKASLDAQVLLLYLFLLKYFTHINAEPDRGQEKRESKEKERKMRDIKK